jgi:SAM-dependent methyltransferase
MGRTSPFRCEGWKVGAHLPFARRLWDSIGRTPCWSDPTGNCHATGATVKIMRRTDLGEAQMTAGLEQAQFSREKVRVQAVNLFLVGFLVLFLELACIRWFAAYVVFLQFFTNVVLIASFLGMSCGCLSARQRHDWLGYFPFIALGTVVAALAVFKIYNHWSGLSIDVGGQASPQEVFFGTEYRHPDVAQFVVPIEAVAGFFFVLVALMFVGFGQVLGRAFDFYPNRVMGYTLNIGGSLTGIVGFSAISFIQAPPVVWFLISCAGAAYLLFQAGSLTRYRALALVALVVGVTLPRHWLSTDFDTRWSPYYMVDHEIPHGWITVNSIGHQAMVPFGSGGPSYSLIHLLEEHSGGVPFRDVLVIGAGSGNDLAHALRFGASQIDAVEIDPVIQDIGRDYHPDHPYQDRRVIPHLDDGRHFLRTTDRKYDLVIYALVDSLVLHSGYANIRLESYLFTQQAFSDVKQVLKPDGIFVMYNYFRQGWIVERIAAMAERTFGCPPVILSLPYEQTLKASSPAGFMMVIAGCNPRIANAFDEHKSFWLNSAPPRNLDVDGFALRPETLPSDQQHNFERISPTTLIHDAGKVISISDDWPFLYLRGKLIPDLTIRSMVILAVLGVGMVYLFLPKGRIVINGRMFFLGAAFMLLETRAVVQMALLFGSTWLVNSAVFFTVLVLILLANLYVLKVQRVHLFWHYVGLMIFLMVGVLTPVDVFLSGGMLWRYAVPCILALGPMFFAGIIFAASFRDATCPDLAFGSNIAGSVLGGLAESFSMLLGFQHLLLLAMLFYLLSAWSPPLRSAGA